MALTLKFRVELSSDGVTLTVTDRTGFYSGTNLGGYGSPNPEVAEALTATIKIAKRNSDGTWGTETTVDAYNDLPSDSSGTFDIDATDGTGEATYSDGIYRFIYTVTGITVALVPFSYSTTRYDVLRNDIAICWQQKAHSYSDCSCNCKDIESDFKCFSLYMRLLMREECGCAEGSGNLNQIQKYLDKLAAMCSSTDSSDCSSCS